jgi:hypothetical protein
MINKKKMKITTKDEQRTFSRELWLNRITKADGLHVTPYFAKPNVIRSPFLSEPIAVLIVLSGFRSVRKQHSFTKVCCRVMALSAFVNVWGFCRTFLNFINSIKCTIL